MTRRRFLPFSPVSYLALLILAGLPACSGTSTEQALETVFERPTETPGSLLARLVEDDWRFFSGAFGVGARDGHEVRFKLDGYVEHDEHHLGDVWALQGTQVDACVLRVFPTSPSRTQVTLEFNYDHQHDAFVFDGGLAHMVLAPRDFDFSRYRSALGERSQ